MEVHITIARSKINTGQTLGANKQAHAHTLFGARHRYVSCHAASSKSYFLVIVRVLRRSDKQQHTIW